MRPEASILRKVCDVHSPPVAVGSPRSFSAVQIERIDSPAKNRVAASRMTAASPGRIVRRSDAYP
jgi:hypothetical protein